MGTVLEGILNEFLEYQISDYYLRKNKQKTKKGEKQLDILFEDPESKHIIYAELKGNIELDTEKIKAMMEKVKQIHTKFATNDYDVSAYVVSLRYLRTSDMSAAQRKKYEGINLIGIADFIDTILPFDVPVELASYTTYSAFLETIVKLIEP